MLGVFARLCEELEGKTLKDLLRVRTIGSKSQSQAGLKSVPCCSVKKRCDMVEFGEMNKLKRLGLSLGSLAEKQQC